MTKSDGGLWQEVKDGLPQVHWQRIESGMTAAGIPDLNGCYEGVEFWIELKKVVGRQVKLSPHQCGWLLKRASVGGSCFVLALDQKRSRLLLWPGALAREIKELGLRAENMASVFPYPVAWSSVLEEIIRLRTPDYGGIWD